jgi:hypothetical protein
MFRPKIALAILALSASACGGGGESNSNSTDSGAPDTADSVAGDAGPDVVMPSDAGPLTDSTSPMDSEASADMPIVDAPTMDAEDAGMDVTMPPDAGTLVDTASQLDAEVSTDTPVTDTALVDAPVQDVPPADAGPPACPSGQQRCGEQCVDLTASVNDCGACGTRCQGADNAVAVCVAGRCALTCAAGFGNCDNNAANGCETNLSTTVSACGACGRACSLANATPVCMGGQCAVGSCTTGFGNCDGNPANGCETNLNTTPSVVRHVRSGVLVAQRHRGLRGRPVHRRELHRGVRQLRQQRRQRLRGQPQHHGGALRRVRAGVRHGPGVLQRHVQQHLRGAHDVL